MSKLHKYLYSNFELLPTLGENELGYEWPQLAQGGHWLHANKTVKTIKSYCLLTSDANTTLNNL